jgi:heat shock protein HtpX
MYSAIARNKRNTVFIVLIFLVIVGALGFAASALWNSPSCSWRRRGTR